MTGDIVYHFEHGPIIFYVSDAGISGDPYKLFIGVRKDDKLRNVRFTVLINNYSIFTPIWKYFAKKKILKCFDMLIS